MSDRAPLSPVPPRWSRRAFIGATAAALVTGARPPRTIAQDAEPRFSEPMILPDRPPGDDFLIRHGYACENTWFAPGNWHTGEDWYLLEGETGGAAVRAVAAGEVVFAGSDYPGRVVIIRHGEALFSMYGHLDYALDVAEGQQVTRGLSIGRVLHRTDGRAPSHLHFEIRTFLTTPEVNGNAPRYGFACGVDCPPGPGYWPIDAPEHPSAMGWRNPTHVINHRAWPQGVPSGVEAVATSSAPERASLWSAPAGNRNATITGDLSLAPGDRFPLLAIEAGPEATTGTSAEAYHLWYQIAPRPGETAWVQAAIPTTDETGADGRPSSVALAWVALGDG